MRRVSSWNSTVSGVEGQIREGEVSAVVPNERMIWTGGFAPIFKGVRTFVLTHRRRSLRGQAPASSPLSFGELAVPAMPDSVRRYDAVCICEKNASAAFSQLFRRQVLDVLGEPPAVAERILEAPGAITPELVRRAA